MDSLPIEKKVKRIIWKSSSRERFTNELTDEKDSSSRMSQDHARKRHRSDTYQLSALTRNGDSDAPENDGAPMNFRHELPNWRPCDPQEISMFSTNNSLHGPCMMPLLPIPNLQERSSDLPIILNGTANRVGTGPPVGAVDIGVSKCAYYFRVALPGVKKDPGMVPFACFFHLVCSNI